MTAELDRACHAIFERLVAGAGGVVHKDELLEAGWPDRVVHENSLAKAISRLRRSLGNDGWRIKAVYGYGYRLVTDDKDGAVEQRMLSRSGVRRSSRLIASAMATVVCFALIAAALRFSAGGETELKIGEPSDVVGRILWVDDHPENNVQEKRFIEDQKMAVYAVTSSDEALKLLAMYRYDAVVSDMGRHGNSLAGLELVKAMRARGDLTPFYIYTIVPSRAQRELLAQHGGQGIAATPDGLYSLILPPIERQVAERAIR